jgi:hypothetical protein
MRLHKLTLEQALELEDQGLLEIYYPGGTQPGMNLDFHPSVDYWISNYTEKTYQHPHIDLENLLEFIEVEYRISVLTNEDLERNSYTWINLFARLSEKARSKEIPKGKYVYILTNKANPDLVKIGKAVDPLQRIKGINNAGVLSEWDLRVALPVTNDYKVETALHKQFADYRVDSDQGSSREFFRISYDTALKCLTILQGYFRNRERFRNFSRKSCLLEV